MTYATSAAVAKNPNNQFASGTVISITDNTSSSALFTGLTTAKPGDVLQRCVAVTYSGSLSPDLNLYATQSGTLPSNLTMAITQGSTVSTPASACGSFVPDSTKYIATQSDGVIWSGLLNTFPTTFATGVDTQGTWASGTTRVYQIQLFVTDATASQNSNATVGFTWEARSQ